MKHVQSGMCINDTSIIQSKSPSWGNNSFVELSNNCLDPAAQFRFLDTGAMFNLKRPGCLTAHFKNGYGYYLDMFYIYVHLDGISSPACAQKRAITQTSWGGLSVSNYKGYRRWREETWCAVSAHYEKLAKNPGIDPYVKLTTSCAYARDKRFNFGEFLLSNRKILLVFSHKY